MPNWIINKLTFLGSEEQNKNILSFVTGENQVIDFNKIIPMPDYIFKGNLGVEEMKKYGTNNWYDWGIDNWGYKWNAHRGIKENNSLIFETPWTPPIPIFQKLTEIFRNSNIDMKWADEDMRHNVGQAIFANGKFKVYSYDEMSDEHKAFEIYVNLWGKSDCLELNTHSHWKKCKKCGICF